MSSEWITTKLGTLVSVNSKSLSVKSNFETIEYIDTASVTENNFDPPVLLKIKDAPSRAKRIVSTGDTIISTVRPSQKHYGYIQNCKKNTIVSTGFAVITPKNIAPSFLYYFLTQENITNYLNNVAETSTSTFPAFKPDIINEIEITLPKDIREQGSIGNFLMQIDNKIRYNNKINQILESISQTLFKSWFVDFDPVKAKITAKELGEDLQLAAMMVISGKSKVEIDQMPADKRKQLAETADLFPDEMMDSELGEIPKGWKISEIGKEVEVLGGSTPSTKEIEYWENGNNSWVTPKDFSGLKSKVLIDSERKITDKGVTQISSGILPVNTVLLSSRAPIGYLAITKIPVSINQGFIAMICNKKLQSTYILNWTFFKMNEIVQRASGTTFLEISKSNFKTIKIIVPSSGVLKKFYAATHKQYTLIEENEKTNKNLVSIRDSILPELLTGKITL